MLFTIDHIAQALLHSLWQIGLMGMILRIALSVITKPRSDMGFPFIAYI